MLSTVAHREYHRTVDDDELMRVHALVQQFLALNELMRRHFSARCEEFDLTPVQARALRELAAGPLPMGDLAGRLGCDASNVTGLSDRLSARGLVQRQPSEGDRRVKVLVLTPEGELVHQRLWQRLMTDSPISKGLSPKQQSSLHKLMVQLTQAQDVPPPDSTGA
jgi:DNA-binding MarR family transcriptional regulator